MAGAKLQRLVRGGGHPQPALAGGSDTSGKWCWLRHSSQAALTLPGGTKTEAQVLKRIAASSNRAGAAHRTARCCPRNCSKPGRLELATTPPLTDAEQARCAQEFTLINMLQPDIQRSRRVSVSSALMAAPLTCWRRLLGGFEYAPPGVRSSMAAIQAQRLQCLLQPSRSLHLVLRRPKIGLRLPDSPSARLRLSLLARVPPPGLHTSHPLHRFSVSRAAASATATRVMAHSMPPRPPVWSASLPRTVTVV